LSALTTAGFQNLASEALGSTFKYPSWPHSTSQALYWFKPARDESEMVRVSTSRVLYRTVRIFLAHALPHDTVGELWRRKYQEVFVIIMHR